MNRTLAIAASLLGFALLVAPAQAQISTAYGKVVDVEGKPLLDAVVRIEAQGGANRVFETKSDKKGEWIQMLQPGTYKFTASKDGYTPSFLDFRIGYGEQANLPNLVLQPGPKGVVTDKKVVQEFNRAVDLTREGKYDEAEAIYRAILEKNNDVREAHMNLGLVLARKKDWAGSEAEYLKAMELRPDAADAPLALAGVYQQAGQADKVKPMLDKAAASPANDGESNFRRGMMLLNMNQIDAAGQAFDAAIKVDPTMAEAYFRLGSAVLLNQGKIPEAVQMLEKYLSLNPTEAANMALAKQLIASLKK